MWVLYEYSHRKKGIFSQSEKITYSDFLADFTLSASALNAIYRYIQRLGTEESSGCLLQTLKRPSAVFPEGRALFSFFSSAGSPARVADKKLQAVLCLFLRIRRGGFSGK